VIVEDPKTQTVDVGANVRFYCRTITAPVGVAICGEVCCLHRHLSVCLFVCLLSGRVKQLSVGISVTVWNGLIMDQRRVDPVLEVILNIF